MVRAGYFKESRCINELKRRGYKILDRNTILKLNQYAATEVDIVAKRGNTLYVIEVKSGEQLITSSIVLKLIKQANKLRAKPILCVGPRVNFTQEAEALIRQYRVRIMVI